jgi:hypothetical protein
VLDMDLTPAAAKGEIVYQGIQHCESPANDDSRLLFFTLSIGGGTDWALAAFSLADRGTCSLN